MRMENTTDGEQEMVRCQKKVKLYLKVHQTFRLATTNKIFKWNHTEGVIINIIRRINDIMTI